MRQLLTGIPFELAGKRVDGLPYNFYSLMEHLHIAQWNDPDFGYHPLSGADKWQVNYSYVHVLPNHGIALKPFVWTSAKTWYISLVQQQTSNCYDNERKA